MEENTARTYRDNLAMAKKLAAEDPRIVANVIKAWIGAND
jgi:flagellar M-ring protein FliF